MQIQRRERREPYSHEKSSRPRHSFTMLDSPGSQLPDFNQGRRERRPVPKNEHAATGGKKEDAAVRLAYQRQPSDERAEESAPAGRPSGMKQEMASCWHGSGHCKAHSAMQSHNRGRRRGVPRLLLQWHSEGSRMALLQKQPFRHRANSAA